MRKGAPRRVSERREGRSECSGRGERAARGVNALVVAPSSSAAAARAAVDARLSRRSPEEKSFRAVREMGNAVEWRRKRRGTWEMGL